MGELVGQTLAGRFLVQREIARSARSIVCEALHTVTKREVAVKMLAVDRAEDKQRADALLEEARLLATVRHPSVVEVLDAGMTRLGDSGIYGPFIAMELLDGRSLEGLLAARGALEIADIIPIANAMCQALDTVHRCDVLHTDITPANIFIPPTPPWNRGWNAGEPNAKLIGFSQARSAAGHSIGGDGRSTKVSAAAYRSPEQILGDPASIRSDIYALGAVLYECLTDEIPARSAPIPPHEKRAEVPKHLSEAVTAAVSLDPEERPEDAQSLAESLWMPQGSVPPRGDTPKRRGDLRAPYVTPVGLELGNRAVRGRCEDVSVGGMLVLTSVPLGEVPEIKVRFALPGSARFVVERAAIRWNRKGRQGLTVSGVQFLALSESSHEAITTYVTHYGRAPMHRWPQQ